MAYCRNCGSEIHDEAVVCVHCGFAVEKRSTAKPDDKKSGGFAFLCFLVPVLGLILYLIWHEDYPLRAKSCAKGAIIGFVLSTLFSIIIVVASFVFGFSIMSSADFQEIYTDSYEYLMLHLI